MRWKIVALALLLIATISAVAIGYEMKKKENIVRGTGTIIWLDLEGGVLGDNW